MGGGLDRRMDLGGLGRIVARYSALYRRVRVVIASTLFLTFSKLVDCK